MRKKNLFNSPSVVRFCKICVNKIKTFFNTKFKHTKNRKGANYLRFDEEGI